MDVKKPPGGGWLGATDGSCQLLAQLNGAAPDDSYEWTNLCI